MNDEKFIPDGVRANDDEMRAIRRHLHAYPELGFEETATSELIAAKLQQWGYEVHRGVGRTGVVGCLRVGRSPRRLGLRADMDALPIVEAGELPYASKNAGRMHACGHDGHTAMLLGAARHLAQTRSFDGCLQLIFQPAEESFGGARVMIEDGLFERFPCDAVFGMHNMPGYPAGKLGFRAGPMMASSDTVVIDVDGVGGHGAKPAQAVDPIVAASSIVMALQTVVSRNVDPLDSAVVTVGAFHAGDAPNVIAATARIKLTVRALKPAIRQLLRERITALAQAQAASFGALAQVDYQWRYPVLVNHPQETELARQVALDWLGEDGLIADLPPETAGEDFAFMLERCPGAYLFIGNGAHDGEHGCMLHHPRYDFNDELLAVGAAYWVRLTERFLSRS